MLKLNIDIHWSEAETVRVTGPEAARRIAEKKLQRLEDTSTMLGINKRMMVMKTRYAIAFTGLICLLALTPMLAYAADISVSATEQHSETIVPQWATGVGVVVGTIGGPIFAVWYAWYMTTIRVPAIEAIHQMNLTAAEARAQVLIANFRLDMENAWRANHDGSDKVVSAIERLSERVATLYHKNDP